MKRLFHLVALLGAAVLAGCGQQSLSLPPPPPHGGTAFSLPEGKGFVEVLRQDVPDQPSQAKLLVYFLDPDCRPLSSTPGAVAFQPRGKKGTKVAFSPAGESDAAKAGALASAPFPDAGDVGGILSATIDGKPISVTVSVR
jgi:hypothetical protein